MLRYEERKKNNTYRILSLQIKTEGGKSGQIRTGMVSKHQITLSLMKNFLL